MNKIKYSLLLDYMLVSFLKNSVKIINVKKYFGLYIELCPFPETITGGRDPTERKIGAGAVKLGCLRKGACQSNLQNKDNRREGLEPLQVHGILEG